MFQRHQPGSLPGPHESTAIQKKRGIYYLATAILTITRKRFIICHKLENSSKWKLNENKVKSTAS